MTSKKFFLIIIAFTSFFLSFNQPSGKTINTNTHSDEMLKIGQMLDSFNLAAANANFDKYFDFMAEDAVFIGTDAREYWTKSEFMKFAKPYFDKKKTWDFRSVERHIYFDKDNDIAWFDELLDTQMKICRGSGVVKKEDERWKIKQYVLSMTIPNSNTKDVVKLKAAEEDIILNGKQ